MSGGLRRSRTKRLGARGGLALAGLLALACSGSSGEPMNSTGDGGPVEVPPWACVPGESQPCDCPDEELDGQRTCNADGSAFGECDCSPGALSQGPPPTGTDTGTGSDTGTASDTATDDGPTTTMDPVTTDGPGSTTDPDPSTTGGTSTTSGGSSGSSTG